MTTEFVGRGAPAPPTRRTTPSARSHAANALGMIAPPLGLTLVLLVIWEAFARSGLVNEIILPPPSAVVVGFGTLLTSDFLLKHLVATMIETLVGFVLGAGGGFVLGALMVVWGPLRKAVYPLAVTLQTLPRVALAPVFITWFGFGLSPKILMAATICFFPVLINTIVGMLSVNEEQLLLLRSLRASRLQEFTELRLPTSGPAVFAGLKTAVTFALIGAIVVELVGAKEGLGVLIERFSFSLQIPMVFAVLTLLGLIGLLLFGIVEVIDRKLIFWVERTRLVAEADGLGVEHTAERGASDDH